jgi:hypothetical protein
MDKTPKVVYHGSPTPGLQAIEPKPSRVLGGDSAVFGTLDADVAISFLVPWTDENFRQGSHDGQFYMQEMAPGNYETFFKGKEGYIYSMDSAAFKSDDRLTRFEVIAKEAQPVLAVRHIPDALTALRQTKFTLYTHGQTLPWEESGDRLNRAQIIETYQALLQRTGLSPDQLWVSSGSALVLHGLRKDAGDVDSGCHQDALDQAAKRLGIAPTPYRANHQYIPEGTPNLLIPDLHADILLEPSTTPHDLVVINGVTCYSLAKLLWQKQALDRPKDQADIANLKKAMSSPTKTGTIMNKHQYLIEAIQAGAYRRRAWCIKAFSVTKHEPYQLGNPVEPYDIVITSEDKVGIYCIDPTSEMKPVKIEGATQTEPIFQMKDRIKLLPGDLPSVKEEIDTTCGNVLVNAMVLIWPFGDKIPFQVGRINGIKLEAMLASKLHDTPEEGATRDKDKIYVDELIKYCDAMAALGSLATLNVPAASPKILTIDPSVIKRRDELLKENADRLHDAATLAKIEAELVAMDKATMKGDPSEGFMISGKQWDVCRKRQFIMLGAEPGFGETQHGVKPIETSLREGWQVKRMPEMIDNLRSGSYNRGAETAMGGESVKYFYRVFQNTRVAEDDCGSTSGLKWKITEDNFKRFVGLHRADITVKTTDKAAKAEASRLTPEVLKSLIGKTIEVRTPMLCKTQSPSFCARCVGDSLAMTPTGLHIAASDVGSAFMLVFMKKMHGVALKTSRYRYKHSIS